MTKPIIFMQQQFHYCQQVTQLLVTTADNHVHVHHMQKQHNYTAALRAS